jgi:biopolymer transport protein ExbB/TolQ
MENITLLYKNSGVVSIPLLVCSILVIAVFLERIWIVMSFKNRDLKIKNRDDLLVFISSIAPMLGLLGTIFGMINAFGSFSSLESIKMNYVAGGISEALYSTAFGMIVSLLAQIVLWVFSWHRMNDNENA